MAEDQNDAFAAWLNDHPLPDLQQLAEKFGGFGRVPAHAWSEYAHDMEQWRETYKQRHWSE